MRGLLVLLLGLAVFGQKAEEARSVLRDGFVERGPEKRREVAVALSLVPASEPAADLLLAMATDEDVLVRQAALVSIAEIGDPKRLRLLKEGLMDAVPEVSYTAAKALYRVNDAAGRDHLLEVFAQEAKADSGYFRSEARSLMRKFKTPKGALLFAAQQGVGFVPLPGLGEGFAALQGILGDAEFSARASAMLLLCQKKDKACGEMLDASFTDDDWSVRAAAVQLILGQRDVKRRERLPELFHDKKEKVRYRAAGAYLALLAPAKGRR